MNVPSAAPIFEPRRTNESGIEITSCADIGITQPMNMPIAQPRAI